LAAEQVEEELRREAEQELAVFKSAWEKIKREELGFYLVLVRYRRHRAPMERQPAVKRGYWTKRAREWWCSGVAAKRWTTRALGTFADMLTEERDRMFPKSKQPGQTASA